MVAGSELLHLYAADTYDETDGDSPTGGPGVCLVVVEDPGELVGALAAARTTSPDARLVVVAPAGDAEALIAAVSAGADGWLPIDTPLPVLERTLDAVARGGNAFSRAATVHLVSELRRLALEASERQAGVSPVDSAGLTPREREVHAAAQAGRTTREIAAELSLSEVTVRWHAGRAGKKLEAAGGTETGVQDVQDVETPEPVPLRRRVNRARTGLTPAELRVALLVSDGLSNKQIAAELFISRHTVESHLKQTFSKLGVRSRVELTRVILAFAGETA